MSKRKIKNKPMVALLIALTINALLFAINWEPVVQGHARSATMYILYSLLYVIGAITFWWSYSIAKEHTSPKWRQINTIAILLAIAWIVFLIFATILGHYWGKAWEQSNWQF